MRLGNDEWFDELKLLLKELHDDTNKNNDTYASSCKVKAVYGRIGSFNILSEITTVTNMLGSTIHIQENDPEEFRLQIEKYIANLDSGTGGQYWPIVKHVILRMPHCDVCSSGTTLVDLPGMKDSNAARDKIAKNGSKSLNLKEKTKKHEENVKNMEHKKAALDSEIANVNNVLHGLRKSIDEQKDEVQELKDNLAKIDSPLKAAEAEQVQSEDLELIQERKEELKTKDALIREKEDQNNELLRQNQEAYEKRTSLEKTISQERKKIATICTLARNKSSSSHIKRGFKDGLREMKGLAGILKSEDPEEGDDIYDDDSADDDRDISSTTDNLRVFCCSSTEYQKMTNLLADDGPPQVFSDLKDTQIPALRDYVHEMTNIQQRQSLERLIHNLGRLVFDMHTYISEGLNTIARGVEAAGIAIKKELERLDTNLGTVLQKLTTDIDHIFEGSLRPKIEEGASSASEEANNTCAKWGAPYIRGKTRNRGEGGLSCPTYQATTRRDGVYKSPTFGPVDFNEDLAAPMCWSFAIVWGEAFSETLWRVFEVLQNDIRTWIKDSTCKLQKQLESLGISVIRIDRLAKQLTEMVRHLKDVVTPRQRGISRIVTPHIQTTMLDEYKQCAADSGNGLFGRMKKYMAEGIENKRSSMFDGAKRMIMDELMKLRVNLVVPSFVIV
ncbi:SLIP-like protein [Mya arenaria]|uniref:SLIP-like protein n=1 Tax=Mya arenaria TaxID=6604 RepID=A0ABY7EUU1_MYAAR|nr:SLIP-like protein [Mya arenaria]